jgi:DNA invertase Pin-like site-specific DNA recombinase
MPAAVPPSRVMPRDTYRDRRAGCRYHIRLAELVLAMLRVAAKLERRRIVERTARGRADAKAKGVRFGRKPILTPHQQKEARDRVEEGKSQRSVARSYNVSQATISRPSR